MEAGRDRGYGATGTVRAALGDFLAAHGRSVEAYGSPSLMVSVGPVRLRFPNPGWLALHDLHHLALGVPPTFWGEVEVSAFELRTGVPSLLVAVLCVGSLLLGALVAPVRVWRSLRRYRGARTLYRGRYEELLGLELTDLQRRMGIQTIVP